MIYSHSLAKLENYFLSPESTMKKFILCFLSIVFPFTVFLFLDLPGAAFVAIGLQSTVIGWPIAMGWALKNVMKYCDDDKLRHASAVAAAAAKAATEAQFAAEERKRAQGNQ